jgi:hypothetical protein
MTRLPRISALLPALSLILFTGATIGVSAVAVADDPPPPSTTPSPEKGCWTAPQSRTGRMQQADDQKLTAGAARRDFVKKCVKSAPAATPSA